ncbi:hypothetical protein BSPWISOXPB_11244 [uncultured Gammaproteobacteria bacterium]|nr:hypothetical protein BSPWISOXPB_11244 [uncultured Gammaproteobacteria bacterium]
MFTSVSLMSLLRSLVLDLGLGFRRIGIGFRLELELGIVLVDVGYLDIATA